MIKFGIFIALPCFVLSVPALIVGRVAASIARRVLGRRPRS